MYMWKTVKKTKRAIFTKVWRKEGRGYDQGVATETF